MPRPSRNMDRALIDAALALIPLQGVERLNIRQVAKKAGVNLGMFHYHFKTKGRFLEIVLQELYDEFFARFEKQAKGSKDPIGDVEQLRCLLLLLGNFLLKNRVLLSALLQDALLGNSQVLSFFSKNIPRHLGILIERIQTCQQIGKVRADLTPIQIIATCAAAIASPIVVGTKVGMIFKKEELFSLIDNQILTTEALEQRIDVVLRGIQT